VPDTAHVLRRRGPHSLPRPLVVVSSHDLEPLAVRSGTGFSIGASDELAKRATELGRVDLEHRATTLRILYVAPLLVREGQ
jgi:hypothetical protein